MNTYDRIAQVIRYLDSAHTQQPDLATLAQQAGMSPFHLHRLFSAWAAITPKDFLQCLTISHAKNLLRKGANILDVSLTTGLSGPGRLHDLAVTLEAATPGEIKSGGVGWTLYTGFAATPFGRCLIAESPRGICHLTFVGQDGDRAELNILKKAWPNARWQRNDSRAGELARQVFQHPQGPASRESLRAFVRGTAFQVKVWRALLKIEPGTLTSYGRLAAALQLPSAARAVGTAVGQNSLAYLIPCHRVIRETGVMGDYRWGAERKRAMVAWESRLPVPAVNRIPKGRVATHGQSRPPQRPSPRQEKELLCSTK